VTASFSALTWLPRFGYWVRLRVQEAPVSTFPRIKLQGTQWTK